MTPSECWSNENCYGDNTLYTTQIGGHFYTNFEMRCLLCYIHCEQVFFLLSLHFSCMAIPRVFFFGGLLLVFHMVLWWGNLTWDTLENIKRKRQFQTEHKTTFYLKFYTSSSKFNLARWRTNNSRLVSQTINTSWITYKGYVNKYCFIFIFTVIQC